jgi:TolB-like protein
VQRAGDRLRVTVKLVDAHDGSQIWAERFDDTVRHVFALQDRVAASVARAVESGGPRPDEG